MLTEGPAIVQYLADIAPQASLLAAVGKAERYEALGWLNYISTELHKNFSPLFKPDASDDMRENARKMLALRLSHIARHLDGHEFLAGASFSVADAYLFTVLSWSDVVKFSLADWPALQAFRARIGARPAVQQALRDEGLLK